jgi:pimeloyl-ACP methyl ester carboxylesterase
MRRTPHFAGHAIVIASALLVCSAAGQTDHQIQQIPSKDGVRIAVECTGRGPSLLFVHGGVGDRTRWTPLFPRFANQFRVCAMDRRGHGQSGDSPDYSLQKESEDVAAVANAFPMFVMGHSYGGVAALEAALLTPRIARLILYEPPLMDRIDEGVIDRMDRLIHAGQREEALILFQRDIVQVSDAELSAIEIPQLLGGSRYDDRLTRSSESRDQSLPVRSRAHPPRNGSYAVAHGESDHLSDSQASVEQSHRRATASRIEDIRRPGAQRDGCHSGRVRGCRDGVPGTSVSWFSADARY